MSPQAVGEALDVEAKTVIGIVGMPGAGKSLAVSVGRRMGCGIVVMGDVIREETERRGLQATSKNVGEVMLKLRQEFGFAIVAKRCMPKIAEAEENVVLVDGIRSLYEVCEFKNRFPRFILLAIHASPETRHKRLFKRKRSDDPVSWNVFLNRDRRELQVGVGSVVATADVMIVNEGKRGAFESEVAEFVESVKVKCSR